ncbi:hypothetical protein B0T24DRAFT_615138 [Lasiosphaeria ovina]|uniref:Uncharacterized protein n=1 Tax=Lasiosphaeria ovina TaxID=92902 RepID=A0AAE0NF37_9PEZI|nr:hypothetical protein B0T24DRAFT_615138 [Lasiosphaeria ovina]
MAYKLITKAGGLKDGLPWELRGMMVANVMFDFAISFFPVLGAVAGAVCRANTRNAWLVDSYLFAMSELARNPMHFPPGFTLPPRRRQGKA